MAGNSPRPNACPTRTVAAMPMPNGTMNRIAAICSAIGAIARARRWRLAIARPRLGIGAARLRAAALRTRLLELVQLAARLVALVLGVGMGSVAVAPGDTLAILAHRLLGLDVARTWSDASEAIVMDLRLPRVLMAMVVGTEPAPEPVTSPVSVVVGVPPAATDPIY